MTTSRVSGRCYTPCTAHQPILQMFFLLCMSPLPASLSFPTHPFFSGTITSFSQGLCIHRICCMVSLLYHLPYYEDCTCCALSGHKSKWLWINLNRHEILHAATLREAPEILCHCSSHIPECCASSLKLVQSHCHFSLQKRDRPVSLLHHLITLNRFWVIHAIPINSIIHYNNLLPPTCIFLLSILPSTGDTAFLLLYHSTFIRYHLYSKIWTLLYRSLASTNLSFS